MSASTDSSATDVDIGADTDAPPRLSALFLIRFDKKVGYTVSWKRTTEPIQLDNAVEYKSLPSGLHTLTSDLVYFVHEGYAGLSAFAKGEASAEERNAAFVSVGILVSRAYGRLGRSWLLAHRLQDLAKTLAEDEGSTAVLEEFWEEQSVYNLSVLSSIPPHAADLLSPGTESLLRLPALFSIGVHDIPELDKTQKQKANGSSETGDDIPSQGWAACTTDEIIASKKQLYDLVVEMPPTYDAPPQKRVWPIMKTANGTQIKASQRDVRRWKMLQRELWRHRRSSRHEDEDEDEDGDDQVALLRKGESDEKDDGLDTVLDDTVVEAMTWPQLAYNGFMWWASAGEQHSYTTAERDRDRDLLGDLSDYADSLPTAVIAYFHRSTTHLIQNLNSFIERSDDEETEEDDGTLLLDKDDVSRMGLDTWSEADKAFLTEFSWMWCGRMVDVRGTSVDCCGVRIPVF
ncbi:hypothetical protein N0V90_011765 [Kalmusia sp. IMI 367209]|nr:hypothetical protein N0V90_011765 [Kalmusia sp. IMI 367209]